MIVLTKGSSRLTEKCAFTRRYHYRARVVVLVQDYNRRQKTIKPSLLPDKDSSV